MLKHRFAEVIKKWTVLGRNEPPKKLFHQVASLHAQKRSSHQVDLLDQSLSIESEKTDGRKVVVIGVLCQSIFRLQLGVPQLFILHLHLNLVYCSS
jgi:hypothetical protein